MRKVLARMREPSTWAAMGAALASLGILTGVSEETWGQIGVGIGAFASVVGMALKEAGSAE